MILLSGREFPDDVFETILDEVIASIISMYASFDFEDFSDAASFTTQSLQEDEGWLPDSNVFTYPEALEVVTIVLKPAREFANELAQAYGRLREKYIGTKSWELYR